MSVASPRLAVFVSSTIRECAPERAAAKHAIQSLNFEPIVFEDLGARPHPARVTYLEALSRSNICVIVWKNSYGYIDPASGLNFSGIEDEYRRARADGLEILIYVSPEQQRDVRLSELITEAQGPYTLASFSSPDELAEKIKNDLTVLVSRVFTERFSQKASRLTDASAVLSGIVGSTAIARPELELAVGAAVKKSQLTWVVGPQGSGKTVLLAQWAKHTGASYLNARGLNARQMLHQIATALSAGESLSVPTSIDEGRELVRTYWTPRSRWPLVIDDPGDVADLNQLLQELNADCPQARIVVATRETRGTVDATVEVPSLSQAEVAAISNRLPSELRSAVASRFDQQTSVLPIDIRRAAAESSSQNTIFDDVVGASADAKSRELLAFLCVSPDPLELSDLMKLASVAEAGVVELESRLANLSFLVVDDGLGYRLVHDKLAEELRAKLDTRPALKKFVSLRLAQFFVAARRYEPAFLLYRGIDRKRALPNALRAASQAAVEGRLSHSIPMLEFIAEERRKEGERIELVVALLSLAQACDVSGDWKRSAEIIQEARTVAEAIGDTSTSQTVEDHALLAKIRHDLKPSDLESLRAIRERYRAEGRIYEAARLAAEEGSILLSVGDHTGAVPVLRDAVAAFREVGDNYGL